MIPFRGHWAPKGISFASRWRPFGSLGLQQDGSVGVPTNMLPYVTIILCQTSERRDVWRVSSHAFFALQMPLSTKTKNIIENGVLRDLPLISVFTFL